MSNYLVVIDIKREPWNLFVCILLSVKGLVVSTCILWHNFVYLHNTINCASTRYTIMIVQVGE